MNIQELYYSLPDDEKFSNDEDFDKAVSEWAGRNYVYIRMFLAAANKGESDG